MIEELLAKGFAYEVNGSVYFDVKKYAAKDPYGKLSGRVIDEILAATAISETRMKNITRQDFALWKNAPPEHLMRWDCPWGEGFPGWHIECSAMTYQYLAHRFDIHGGGMDLMFPHHESEIAKAPFAIRDWPVTLHNNMITVNGKKMGKSYGNQIMLTQMFSGNHPLLEQAYSPMTIRFFILQTHYRSTLDFGNDALQAAEKGLKRLWEAYELLKKMTIGEQASAGDAELDAKVNKLLKELDEFMNDDFNTAKVLASLFELVPVINSIKDGHIKVTAISTTTVALLKEYFKAYLENILGLQGESAANDGKLNGVLELLIDIRKEAKTRKDYATSDKIRNQLLQLGVVLKDDKDGGVSYTFS